MLFWKYILSHGYHRKHIIILILYIWNISEYYIFFCRISSKPTLALTGPTNCGGPASRFFLKNRVQVSFSNTRKGTGGQVLTHKKKEREKNATATGQLPWYSCCFLQGSQNNHTLFRPIGNIIPPTSGREGLRFGCAGTNSYSSKCEWMRAELQSTLSTRKSCSIQLFSFVVSRGGSYQRSMGTEKCCWRLGSALCIRLVCMGHF